MSRTFEFVLAGLFWLLPMPCSSLTPRLQNRDGHFPMPLSNERVAHVTYAMPPAATAAAAAVPDSDVPAAAAAAVEERRVSTPVGAWGGGDATGTADPTAALTLGACGGRRRCGRSAASATAACARGGCGGAPPQMQLQISRGGVHYKAAWKAGRAGRRTIGAQPPGLRRRGRRPTPLRSLTARRVPRAPARQSGWCGRGRSSAGATAAARRQPRPRPRRRRRRPWGPRSPRRYGRPRRWWWRCSERQGRFRGRGWTTADGARATAVPAATGTGSAGMVVTAVFVGSTGGAMSAGGRGHPVGSERVWHARSSITRGHLYVRLLLVAADGRLLLPSVMWFSASDGSEWPIFADADRASFEPHLSLL